MTTKNSLTVKIRLFLSYIASKQYPTSRTHWISNCRSGQALYNSSLNLPSTSPSCAKVTVSAWLIPKRTPYSSNILKSVPIISFDERDVRESVAENISTPYSFASSPHIDDKSLIASISS